MAEHDLILVTCAFPGQADAIEVARKLVAAKLAAAVHVTPTTSCFNWNGVQAEVQEYVLEAKTAYRLFERVVNTIKVKHTYILPGISFMKLAGGTEEYLNWIAASLIDQEAKV